METSADEALCSARNLQASVKSSHSTMYKSQIWSGLVPCKFSLYGPCDLPTFLVLIKTGLKRLRTVCGALFKEYDCDYECSLYIIINENGFFVAETVATMGW